jgi:hypothetical protein
MKHTKNENHESQEKNSAEFQNKNLDKKKSLKEKRVKGK